MSASHTGVPVQVPAAPLLTHHLANAPQRPLEDSPSTGDHCHQQWGTQMEFWTIDFGLDQPWPLCLFGEGTSIWKISLSLSLCHFCFQINEWLKKERKKERKKWNHFKGHKAADLQKIYYFAFLVILVVLQWSWPFSPFPSHRIKSLLTDLTELLKL